MFKRIAFTAALIATFALGASAFGLAGNGNGSNKSSSSINLVIVASPTLSATATSGPHYGDTVTFDVYTPATDSPFVNLNCSQNGTIVYSASARFSAGNQWPFLLSSNAWTGGAANCTATLYYWDGHRFRDLTAMDFSADA